MGDVRLPGDHLDLGKGVLRPWFLMENEEGNSAFSEEIIGKACGKVCMPDFHPIHFTTVKRIFPLPGQISTLQRPETDVHRSELK
jgi:hypothetical protein